MWTSHLTGKWLLLEQLLDGVQLQQLWVTDDEIHIPGLKFLELRRYHIVFTTSVQWFHEVTVDDDATLPKSYLLFHYYSVQGVDNHHTAGLQTQIRQSLDNDSFTVTSRKNRHHIAYHTALDCSIVPPCAAWGSAAIGTISGLSKRRGFLPYVIRPTDSTMHCGRKFRMACTGQGGRWLLFWFLQTSSACSHDVNDNWLISRERSAR